MNQRPLLPASFATVARPSFSGDPDGAVIQHAGRYARESVLVAFEMIGGVDRLAAWADKNPTEFFTRIFTKTITREVEMSASKGVEDLLAQLDRGTVAEPHETMDAEILDDE